MGDCWVYKAYSLHESADRLLYVGISDTPTDRMAQHARDKWWWHLVNRIEWFKVDSREQAASLETKLIATKMPLFNKHQSTRTAGSVLFGCLDLIAYSFEHCPLCHSACRYSRVEWEPQLLCSVDVDEEHTAHCFEVRMRCSAHHPCAEWTQLIPIDALCECRTKMPECVLDELWNAADSNGEVGDDIRELRPPTLDEMFSLAFCGNQSSKQMLIETK